LWPNARKCSKSRCRKVHSERVAGFDVHCREHEEVFDLMLKLDDINEVGEDIEDEDAGLDREMEAALRELELYKESRTGQVIAGDVAEIEKRIEDVDACNLEVKGQLAVIRAEAEEIRCKIAIEEGGSGAMD
jgi:hypothetical protein